MIIALLLAAQTIPDCADERIAMAQMADAIEQRYVLEDKALSAASRLREQSEAGQLDQHCDDPKAFAQKLTTYLRTQMEDDHVHVEYAPESAGSGDNDWLEEWRADAAGRGFGVKKIERMDGNIAYLHLTDFYELDMMRDSLAAAFQLVESSDGLILDLRNNPGGSPETEWPVQWTFMKAGAPLPLRRESRSGSLPDLEEPDITWPRYGTDKPLIILVNRRTFSAPEAVAYSLQAQGRALVIGSASGGGANMLGDGVAVSGGWKIGVPEIRPYSPHTGKNWERTGIVPDIVSEDSEAIAKAHDWILGKLESKRAAP
jgi:C-terminal processing protease CtpA/Prc